MASSTSSADFESVTAALSQSLRATQSLARQLPDHNDLRYQRTLSRPLGKKVDVASQRLLHITNRVLEVAKQANSAKGKKAVSSNRPLDQEDLIDGYQNRIVQVTDQLLEQIDRNLDEQERAIKKRKTKPSSIAPAVPGLTSAAAAATSDEDIPVASTSAAVASNSSTKRRSTSPTSFRNAGNIVKPQTRFSEETNNARDFVFKPLITSKLHGTSPLDLALHKHVDPLTGRESMRVSNPYEKEIEEALRIPFPELQDPDTDSDASMPDSGGTTVKQKLKLMESQMDSKPFTYVDSEASLQKCLDKLRKEKFIAIDLEHHDMRTFIGLTSLIQISTFKDDFIVDPLVPEVKTALSSLNEVFADPKIVKILHGADSDVIWLQRDLGLYLVNLFDTYRASRALGRLSGHSLASLLREYTTFMPEKKYQLADWRLRPLSPELIKYARSDTHFLLFIFQQMLKHPAMTPTLLQEIRLQSAEVAKQAYEAPAYDFEQGYGLNGWRKLAEKTGKNVTWDIDGLLALAETSGQQSTNTTAKWRDSQARAKFETFRLIHDWRDKTAREEDESLHYILPNKTIIALAETLPKDSKQFNLAVGGELKTPQRQAMPALLGLVQQGLTKAEEQKATIATEAAETAQSGKAKPSATSGPSSLWQRSASPATNPATSKEPHSRTSTLFGAPEAKPAHAATTKFKSVLSKVHKALSGQMQIANGLDWTLSTASTAEPSKPTESDESQVKTKKVKTEPAEDDIVQVSSNTKSKGKKRKLTEQEPAANTASTSAPAATIKSGTKSLAGKPFVKPFDYSTEKSVLDMPVVKKEDESPRKKKKGGRKGEGDAALDLGDAANGPAFKKAPKSMNQPKAGNRSHTFM